VNVGGVNIGVQCGILRSSGRVAFRGLPNGNARTAAECTTAPEAHPTVHAWAMRAISHARQPCVLRAAGAVGSRFTAAVEAGGIAVFGIIGRMAGMLAGISGGSMRCLMLGTAG